MEKLDLKGEWWVPGKSEDKIPGELKFNPQGESCLKLYKSKGNFDEFNKSIKVVLGETFKNKKLTILNCHPKKAKRYHSTDGDEENVISTFLIEKVFLGEHFKKGKPKFDKIRFKFPYLVRWINKETTSINRTKDNKKREITLDSYSKKMELRDVKINIKKTAEVNSSNSLFSSRSWGARDKVYTEVLSQDKITSKKANKILSKLQGFLSLILNESVNPDSIEGYLEREKEKPPKRVDIYYPTAGKGSEDEVFSPFWVKVPFSSIERGLSDIMRNWFSLWNDCEDILNVYFGVKYRDLGSMYPHNRFMNLVTSLEAFHRRKIKEEGEDGYLKKKEWKKKKEKIDNSVEKVFPDSPDSEDPLGKVKNNLKTGIGRSNTYSLKDRLLDILEENKFLEKKLGINRKFIKRVKGTRNHFAHISKSPEERMSWEEIGKAIPKLRVMLEACILKEIGISEDKLQVSPM